MPSLFEPLGDWLARVELLARGAEQARARAARALAEGRPAQARSLALGLLDELPRSRVALLLWADAAEAMMLDAESAEASERLARALPERADAWLRLALARARAGLGPEAALLAAAEAGEPLRAADSARLRLAELDLARGDPARAERWLAQLGLAERGGPEAALRRAEARLDRGDLEEARRLVATLPAPEALDGRRALVEARLSAAAGDERGAARSLVRALLLDAPRASRYAAELIARARDRAAVESLSAVGAALGYAAQPSFRAAVAEAEGRTADALAALAEGAGDPELAARYLAAALTARDPVALRDAVARAVAAGVPVAPGIAALLASLDAALPEARLAALDAADGPATDWAAALRVEAYAALAPEGEPAAWRELLAELGRLARALGELGALGDVEALAVDLERPLRAAVVGEFNAGKSTFINALLGEAVAPVGVLPTTATRNHLVWAPDRFVRVELVEGGEARVVSHGALGATLVSLGPALIDRVTIYAPLELLRRVELIDTPGFNAPDRRHAAVTRTVFDDVHVVIWLLDATQPLKASEREVLGELARRELPLLVLLSKLDRLGGAEELAAALRHVEQGLAAAGVRVEAPPIAFSARLALEGGADAAARERSGWPAVERLVERVLFDDAARLRERVARRRAATLAAALARVATERAAERERGADEEDARRARCRAVAHDARARGGELAEGLGRVIDEAMAELARELRPVAGGAAEDDAVMDFVASRLRGRLARAAADELGRAIPPSEREVLGAALEPRLAAMAAALAPWLHGGGAAGALARRRLAREAVRELERVAAGRFREVARPAAPPAERRALALVRALG